MVDINTPLHETSVLDLLVSVTGLDDGPRGVFRVIDIGRAMVYVIGDCGEGGFL
jgi:hypothetical protein